MRKRLPWLLLAVSIAANGMFLAGWFQARQNVDQAFRSPAERVALLADQLGLSPEQTEDLAALRDRLRGQFREGRRETRAVRGALMQALTSDTPDQAAVDAALTQLLDQREDRARLVLAELGAFARTLSPEQRERLRELVEQRNPIRMLLR